MDLSPTFRTTSDSTGLVSNKDPPLHRLAELKVLGGSTYCKSYDRLFKTQVWQFVSPKLEDESKAQRSSVKTMQSLFSQHRWQSPFFPLSSSPYFFLILAFILVLLTVGQLLRSVTDLSRKKVSGSAREVWEISSGRRGCRYFSWWYLSFIEIHVGCVLNTQYDLLSKQRSCWRQQNNQQMIIFSVLLKDSVRSM